MSWMYPDISYELRDKLEFPKRLLTVEVTMTSGITDSPDWEGHKSASDSDFEGIANDGIKLDKRLEDYNRWLRHQGLDIAHLERYYGSVRDAMERAWHQSPFWHALLSTWEQMEYEYQDHIGNRRSRLFKDDKPELRLQTKEYRDFLIKTLRKNSIIHNTSSDNRWFLPPDWYTQIHDIVRMEIVVMHIDGVDFLINRLSDLASACEVQPSEPDFKPGLEGYYAAHLEVKIEDVEVGPEEGPFEHTSALGLQRADFPPTREVDAGFDGNRSSLRYPRSIPAYLEIQVRTQLQETIYQILHDFYELQRLKSTVSGQGGAKWDYTSDHFGVTYLGHVLHYIEGMVVQARNKQKQIRESEEFQTRDEAKRETRQQSEDRNAENR